MKRKKKYKPVINSYLPGALVREDSAKSQKCIKNLYSVLSVITFMVLMSFFYQLGSGIMKNQLTAEINSWKRRAIEAEKVIEDVEKVEKAMRRFIPKEDRRRKEAAIFVGKARAFGLPLKVAMVSAEAETCYNINAIGPFGERGTHQAMYWTMRSYFPECDESLIYWEAASWLHLKDCYEASGRDLFGTVAMHNAGRHRGVSYAMRAGWKHVNRCRRIARGLSV
jgi:hypothetical protein